MLPISFSYTIGDRFFYKLSLSPFLSILINISDIFLLFSITIFLWLLFNKKIDKQNFQNKIINITFLLLCVSLFIISPFAKDKVIHIFLCIKFIGIIFLFLYIPENIIKKEEISKILLYTFIIQGIIAIIQFIVQHSIGLSILGEPTIANNLPNIAKIDLITGDKIIRPYGTMQHSNILGISSIIVYFLNNSKLRYLLIIPIIISFSRTAWLILLTLFLIDIVYKNKENIKKICYYSIPTILILIPFIIPRLNIFDNSLYERINLYISSFKMLFANPFGIGFGNFTLNLQNYNDKILNPWEIQPVHNVFLLFANEVGVVSLIILFILFYLIMKNSKENIQTKLGILSIVFIAGSFDHFFLTSTIGMVLLFSLYK